MIKKIKFGCLIGIFGCICLISFLFLLIANHCNKIKNNHTYITINQTVQNKENLL